MPVLAGHAVVRLELMDGRSVLVSPGHPLLDGRPVAILRAGDAFAGSLVASADRIPYDEGRTLDLLPTGGTGVYWANAAATPAAPVQHDATMDHDPEVPRQTWQLLLDGSPELVELVPYSGRLWGTPGSFRVGAVERKLEYAAGVSRSQRFKAPLVGSVDVGAHRLAMTLTTIRPAYRSAVRRNISGLKRSGPLSFLGTILGGAGLGGGAAAAVQSTLVWLIYELSVDGELSGSWVAKTVDGRAEGWTFVPPGGSLPDSDIPDW